MSDDFWKRFTVSSNGTVSMTPYGLRRAIEKRYGSKPMTTPRETPLTDALAARDDNDRTSDLFDSHRSLERTVSELRELLLDCVEALRKIGCLKWAQPDCDCVRCAALAAQEKP
jgi:hypothetical protein